MSVNDAEDSAKTAWTAFAAWCHDHGKFSAVLIAFAFGMAVGAWLAH